MDGWYMHMGAGSHHRGGSGVIARGESPMLSVDELKFKSNQNSPPGKYHSRAKVEKDIVLMTIHQSIQPGKRERV